MAKGLAVAVLAAAQVSPAAAQDGPMLVNKAEFDCLMSQLGRVPSEQRGVFIDISDCPRRGIRIIRHLIAPPPVARGATATKIFIRPNELRCLQRNRAQLPRIARALEGGRYSVTLAPCPR